MDIKSVVFRCSALQAGQRPGEPFAQVAVAGRSNVGKSSLLNWLFRQPVARVAKAPGRTRALNFFLVNNTFFVVDLPGYGYAKVGSRLRESWGRELASFVSTENRLAGVICLLDIRREITPSDADLFSFLAEVGREKVVVLTKADKVGRSERARVQQVVQRQLGLATPLAVSVKSGDARGELLAEVEKLLGSWRAREGRD